MTKTPHKDKRLKMMPAGERAHRRPAPRRPVVRIAFPRPRPA